MDTDGGIQCRAATHRPACPWTTTTAAAPSETAGCARRACVSARRPCCCCAHFLTETAACEGVAGEQWGHSGPPSVRHDAEDAGGATGDAPDARAASTTAEAEVRRAAGRLGNDGERWWPAGPTRERVYGSVGEWSGRARTRPRRRRKRRSGDTGEDSGCWRAWRW